MPTVKLTARRSKQDLRTKQDLRNHDLIRAAVTVTKLPKRAKDALKDILGGLREFVKDEALLRALVEGEDETKAARSALKGQHGGEIKFALGYIYALADVYDVEPVELVS